MKCPHCGEETDIVQRWAVFERVDSGGYPIKDGCPYVLCLCNEKTHKPIGFAIVGDFIQFVEQAKQMRRSR